MAGRGLETRRFKTRILHCEMMEQNEIVRGRMRILTIDEGDKYNLADGRAVD